MMDAASTVLVAGIDGVEMTSSEIEFYREASGVTLSKEYCRGFSSCKGSK